MTFNSVAFLQFFAAFLLLYHLVRHHLDHRNLLITIASLFFYGWWDPRFVALLVFTAAVDYAVGLKLEQPLEPARRKRWLALSLGTNLLVLGFFKYCNFFSTSLSTALAAVGWHIPASHLEIILPVGISFYTFQSMSYAVDVYRRDIPACRNFIRFLAFVAFFPQLVAGPIERAGHLLTQIESPRVIRLPMIREGLWLILWGLFKKVVVADNLAPIVDMAYHPTHHSGPLVALGTFAFAFQIYCDFSGYSDIARGAARWLGFDLMLNFNLPYTATSPRDFWRRWHISLSTWLRDYLYRPLGGNRHGPTRTHRNLLLTMLLGGLWHGASWNFIAWGAWHGLGLVIHRLWTSRPHAAASAANPLHTAAAWIATQSFVLYGWLLFRAGSLEEILRLSTALANPTAPAWFPAALHATATWIAPVVLMEFWMWRSRDPMRPLTLSKPLLILLQAALISAIILCWSSAYSPFIYFQF